MHFILCCPANTIFISKTGSMNRLIVLMITGALWLTFAGGYDSGRRAEVLFLGQKGTIHASWLATKLFKKSGINLTYTENAADLTAAGLSAYDGLIVNTGVPPHACARRGCGQFVASGKGLIILNKGAAAFKNSAWAARSGTEGKGRIFYTKEGTEDDEWKERAFLDKCATASLWALGEEVRRQIIAVIRN